MGAAIKHHVPNRIKTSLADRTNGRAYATVLRLSVVCDVMYCG